MLNRNLPPNPSSAAEAEAYGEETVTATYMGRAWRLPTDADAWPLALIRRCLWLTPDRRIVVNHVAVAEALEQLLGEQWGDFVQAAPKRRHLVPAAQVFAAAAGMPAGTETDGYGNVMDQAFGAIPRLLAVLDSWPTAVESDLDRFWNIDYRDRWRFDDGQRRLTLRMIYARLCCNLPAESGLAIAMGRRSPTELLLMDIYEPLARRPHPARPLTAEQAAERHAEAAKAAKAVADYEARRTARGDRNRIKTGLDNARANARRGA